MPFVPQASKTQHPIDKLLPIAQQKLGIKKRSDVHEMIGVTAPITSKIRHNKVKVSAELILRLHDATGISVDEIRERLGIKKFQYTPPVANNAQSSGA